MSFSVRDLCILTAYAALMLSPSPALKILLMGASAAAFVLVAFVFGMSTLRRIGVFHQSGSARRSCLPLFLLFVVWVTFPVIGSIWLKRLPSELEDIALSMALGLSGASIPLMFNLDSRTLQLNDQTLCVGYWTLCAAMTSAGIVAMLLLLQPADTGLRLGIEIHRLSAVIGVTMSVLMTWWLLARLERSDEVGRDCP